jgi:hypothetical protein
MGRQSRVVEEAAEVLPLLEMEGTVVVQAVVAAAEEALTRALPLALEGTGGTHKSLFGFSDSSTNEL